MKKKQERRFEKQLKKAARLLLGDGVRFFTEEEGGVRFHGEPAIEWLESEGFPSRVAHAAVEAYVDWLGLICEQARTAVKANGDDVTTPGELTATIALYGTPEHIEYVSVALLRGTAVEDVRIWKLDEVDRETVMDDVRKYCREAGVHEQAVMISDKINPVEYCDDCGELIIVIDPPKAPYPFKPEESN